MSSFIPAGYKSALNLYETQTAIALIKRTFQDALAAVLTLKRVSAPLFVDPAAGLNDNLSGVERPVAFDVPSAGMNAEVVHSLAKWKREALHRYGFREGQGIYTDMNAIRRDENLDNLHSVYVDQWDWEKIISPADRNPDTLKRTVTAIVEAICYTSAVVNAKYRLNTSLEHDVTFIDSQELLDMYPDCPAKERERRFAKAHGTICILRIGAPLSNGLPHDSRAPDYDDWQLNCDIIFYNPLLDCAFEISSMGIRVCPESLRAQLKASGCESRAELPFHRQLLAGELEQTIGGGIGQSRMCMLLLGKAHIGEVQSSVWDSDTIELCKNAGVVLL